MFDIDRPTTIRDPKHISGWVNYKQNVLLVLGTKRNKQSNWWMMFSVSWFYLC